MRALMLVRDLQIKVNIFMTQLLNTRTKKNIHFFNYSKFVCYLHLLGLEVGEQVHVAQARSEKNAVEKLS